MKMDDLRDAWAVVRPEPKKERMMAWMLMRDGAEVFTPTLLTAAGNGALVARPMYLGYVFVRPRLGRREAMMQLPYIVDVLSGVLNDRLIGAIRDYCVEHDNVKREERSLQDKAAPVRVFKSFADIGAAAVMEAIDSRNLSALFMSIERDSHCWAGKLENYLRTDDLADKANISAVAMVRGSLRFE